MRNGDEMMDELKPCPFCGQMPRGILGGYFACKNIKCEIFNVSVPVDGWATRPVEDKLQSQLASRDALIERLVDCADQKFRPERSTWTERTIDEKWDALCAEYQAMKGGEG